MTKDTFLKDWLKEAKKPLLKPVIWKELGYWAFMIALGVIVMLFIGLFVVDYLVVLGIYLGELF